MKEIIKLYNDTRKTRNIQFIASTHESRLIDASLLRKDEIWFMDSNDNSGSTIYPLDSFDDDFKSWDLEYAI